MTQKGLKKSSQFKRVYREGRREAGNKIVIYCIEAGDGGILPGFVASKKNVGKRACQRNRAKRLMREAYRGIVDRITEKNLWIVFIASFDPSETTLGQIKEDVESSLGRAGLISNNG